MSSYVEAKLECADCGAPLEVPKGTSNDTLIMCDDCGTPIGEWGEIQKSAGGAAEAEARKAAAKGIADFKKSLRRRR